MVEAVRVAATATRRPDRVASASPWLVVLGLALACTGDAKDDEDAEGDGAGSSTATLPDTGADGSTGTATPRCGDGVIEGDEVCDGDNLGGMTCAEQPGFMGGAIACAADCRALDLDGCEPEAAPLRIRFNEVVSAPIEDGDFAGALDAIELINGGEVAVDLGGYRLSDQLDVPEEGSLTLDGPVLGPGELLVLTQADPRGPEGYPFDIPERGSVLLTLLDADGGVADSVELAGENAVDAWCRVPDEIGVWQVCARSLGELNE